MDMKTFKGITLDYAVAWFDALYELIKDDRTAKKIEPEQKRQLIATAQSLALFIQDELERILNGSDTSISE